jgi:hypothetical protein
MDKYKIDKLILNKLEIPDKLYTKYSLKFNVFNKLKKTNNQKIKLSLNNDIKKLLNIETDIHINDLIILLIEKNAEIMNKPNCYYLSYHKKPNYDLIIKKIE